VDSPTVTQMARDVDNTLSSQFDSDTVDLIQRLRIRAAIRRQIPNRKSVLEGKSDRISDLLEEAANKIESMLR